MQPFCRLLTAENYLKFLLILTKVLSQQMKVHLHGKGIKVVNNDKTDVKNITI